MGAPQAPIQKVRLGFLGPPFSNPELLRAHPVTEPLLLLSLVDRQDSWDS